MFHVEQMFDLAKRRGGVSTLPRLFCMKIIDILWLQWSLLDSTLATLCYKGGGDQQPKEERLCTFPAKDHQTKWFTTNTAGMPK